MMTDRIRAEIAEAFLNTDGWCTPEKAQVLCELVFSYQPALMVEIGIFGGRSLMALGIASRCLGLGPVWGIDPWTVQAAIEGENGPVNDAWWKTVDLERIYSGFMQHVIKERLTWYCRWLRCTSDEALRFFDDGSIGLLHQDSNHSELVSCREVEQWHKKLTPKALWILDDSDWASQKKAIGLIGDKGFKLLADHQTYMIFQRT